MLIKTLFKGGSILTAEILVKNNFKKSILIAEMLVGKQFQGRTILTAEILVASNFKGEAF